MFTIPTRLFLTAEQRVKLEHLVRQEQLDLADLVSQIVVAYLDTVPDTPPEPHASTNRDDMIRARRAELNRLYQRRALAGSAAPAWLHSYIADLEAELRQLEAS